jgi:tetratricopeptide (TPR) repeat protein
LEKSCEICNRSIEKHLGDLGKLVCFSCLTQQVGEKGAIPAFNLKEKPVLALCAVCEKETTGNELVPAPWGFICKECCDICQTQSGVSWEIVTLAAQKEWLIKANLKVLGPYTTSEVDGLLRENRIVAHDETMRPMGRWHLLRDEEQFRLVVNEVKNRQQHKRASDNTVSGTMTPGSHTPGTKTPHLEVKDGTMMGDRTIILDRVEESERPSKENTRDLLKSYISKAEPIVVVDLIKIKDRKFWTGLSFFLILGLFLALKFTQPGGGSPNSRNIHFQELMTSGLSAEKVGEYQKALGFYSEARTLRPDDPELLMHLAPLTLIYDQQLVQAQRMFKQLYDTVKESNYQKTSLVGLGLIALDSHELNTGRDFFENARKIDPEYMAAIADLGLVAFFKDDFHSAEDYLLKALEKGNTDGAVVISLADSYIAQGIQAGGKGKLVSAHNLIEQFLSLSRDYEQEALVEDARILTLQGKDSEAAKRIETFLDVDPEQTENHFHDWGIFRGRVSWGLLLDTLRKVSGQLSSSPRLTGAMGLAMYRGQEKLEGAQAVEQALSQAPHDPLLMALAGWIEIKLGHHETGAVNIKQAALESDKYKLPHILQARLCDEEKDFECARRQWEIVLKIDSRSVEALYGLASVAWSHQDKEMAQNYLTQLYANDPTYIPYLQLHQAMITAK